MGIPRFYRYVSERYPLINQPISDVSLLPEFDCFYLDMNGIIHNCTHGDSSDDERSTLTLAEQLHRIFTVIDRLVTHIIKPKQIVYIAIDGVAPRAKLNQQRSRRFRAGLDRMKQMEAERVHAPSSDELPEKHGVSAATAMDSHFDSNSITPGTAFLQALSQHLVYFLRQRMQADPLWSRLEVYFSGSEVPGEGEHKIADFIRSRKMQPGYPANVRHCMYGSDADLMLLGLMTHEPHFTLIRETVQWGGPSKGKVVAKKVEEEQWQLVHLSLFREYLLKELHVHGATSAQLNGERMLDDFVFLTYLLGNDFIPHSPTLEIREDAIPLLLQVYVALLTKHEGRYLTCDGRVVNVTMLQDLFETIGEKEEMILIDRAEAEMKRKGKGGRMDRMAQEVLANQEDEDAVAVNGQLLASLNFGDEDDDDLPPLEDEDDEELDEDEVEEEMIQALEGEYEAQMAKAMDEEEQELVETLTGSKSFQDVKWKYYERKFAIQRGNGSMYNKELEKLKKHYLEALLWCLEYYFQGPPSWSWYYPYHYSPMFSDLTNIAPVLQSISFVSDEDDGPLLPFEQLMANLPASSAYLVPEPYRFLMVSPLSPIKHFYPEKFEIDMEGKRNEWEGVNLLPFIDVKLLKDAIAQYCPPNRLTAAERQRNQLQRHLWRIVYDPRVVDTVPSTMPGVRGFPDIVSCATRVEPFVHVPIEQNKGRFASALVPGVELPLAGFPSLSTLPLMDTQVRCVDLNCFGMKTKKATLVLCVGYSMGEVTQWDPRSVLNTCVMVNWPHLHEARVVAVSCERGTYRLNEAAHGPPVVFEDFSDDEKKDWRRTATVEEVRLLSGRGTPGTGGIDLTGSGITYALHVLPLQGMVTDPATGALKKRFGSQAAIVPLQLALLSSTMEDKRFEETAGMRLQERFPMDSQVLITQGRWKGCTAKVCGYHDERSMVSVRVSTMDVEPPFGYLLQEQLAERYRPGYIVAKETGLKSSTIGLLVGSVRVAPLGIEIGLQLRFRKHLTLPGYCRLVPKSFGGKNSAKGSDPQVSQEDASVWRTGDIVKILGSDVASRSDNAQREDQGNGNGTAWEYSDRVVELLRAYKAYFPDVIANLEKLPFATSYAAKSVFGALDRAAMSKRADELVTWIQSLGLAKKDRCQHVPVTSRCMSATAIKAAEAAGAVRAKERERHSAADASALQLVKVRASELYRPNPLVNQDLTAHDISRMVSTNPGAPLLGDRVINLCARGVPFGLRGTVVATHVSSQCVEVLFDEGFIGGEPLFATASADRGKIVPWNNLLCVSVPPAASQASAQRRRDAAAKNQQRMARDPVAKQSFHQRKQTSRPQFVPRPQSAGSNAHTTTHHDSQTVSENPSLNVPAPAPPDPTKLEPFLKKWGAKGQARKQPSSQTAPAPASSSLAPSAPATDQTSAELAPSVAALMQNWSSMQGSQGKTDNRGPPPPVDHQVAPNVAAFFSAAAQAPPPPPGHTPVPPQSADSTAMANLFPHTYAPPRPGLSPHAAPYAPPVYQQPPPPPPMPYAAPPPPRPRPALMVPSTVSGQQSKPKGKKAASTTGSSKWVPKPSSNTGQPRSLLLPAQVLRQQPKASSKQPAASQQN